jgi:hypothetical protein
MKCGLVCALLLAIVSAASAQKIIYTKEFPGSVPAYVWIQVDRNGDAQYKESPDDNAEKLQLGEDAAAAMFGLASSLDHFKHPLESGLKVANMGTKTFRWEDADAKPGDAKQEVKFNYSLEEDAKTLHDWFERITESVRQLVLLRRAIRHDRLGVHQALIDIENLYVDKKLVATAQFLPLFDRVAGDEQYLHMARTRAARLAEAIRAASKTP